MSSFNTGYAHRNDDNYKIEKSMAAAMAPITDVETTAMNFVQISGAFNLTIGYIFVPNEEAH
jgi:hypothetical protein